MTARPDGITDKQWQARQDFDRDPEASLDAAMAALPPPGPAKLTAKGAAGYRMQAHHVADISDDLLREFARETLKAERMSEQYLDALRVVLGNQAAAERYGYTLEMNQRVDFAPARVVRTILDQMQAAGITTGRAIGLGAGRRQVVQCFSSHEAHEGNPAKELERTYRKTEGERAYDMTQHPSIRDEDIPY